MKRATIGLAVLSAVWLALVTAAPQAAQSKSVVDGVYTDAQATRGDEAYKKNCGSCHGPALEGDGFAPALSGTEFLSNWNGTTLGDLYDRVRISMPPENPGSVPPEAKVDIITHLLKANKFPAGQAELASTAETLKDIKFELPK
jgi:hypothetical protein